MKDKDYEIIRGSLVNDLANARAASLGPRVQELTATIKRLDEEHTKGKKTKLMESEVKSEEK